MIPISRLWSLITDLFRHGGINAITPTRRVTGGPVYAQFGSPIKSGIVPRPSGKEWNRILISAEPSLSDDDKRY